MSTAHSSSSITSSVMEKEKVDEAAARAPAPPITATAPGTEPEQNGDATAEIEYPSGAQLAIIMVGLMLAVLLIALDNTIIATAIPKITDQFNALSDVGWYASAYMLTTCALQLVYGKLYKYYSIKWVFMIAILIFEIGSAICGAAPTSVALIVGRAIAGIGSAGIFSGAMTILAYATPMDKRPVYMGIVSSMFGVASIIGPLLGGAFTDHVSWRWCFYINLPIGAITIAAILFFLHLPKRNIPKMSIWQQLGQMDLPGTSVFIPAVVCLLLALQWGGSKYAWSNGRIIALFIVFGILIIAFVGIQIWKGEAATVPPRIMKMRNIWTSSFFVVCLAGSFFSLVYYIPIWFQAIKGASATHSGIMLIPMVLGVVVASVGTGAAVTNLGYPNPFMIVSAVLASIGAGLLTTFTISTGHSAWIGYQVLYGLGIGCGMQQGIMLAQASLKLDDIPVGTAVIMLCQMLGGALFVSVTENQFNSKLASGIAAAVPGIDPAVVLNTGATSLQKQIPKEYLHAVLIVYNNALTKAFQVPLVLMCLSIIGALAAKWISVKANKATPAKKAEEGKAKEIEVESV